ncbi:ABC transporter ATP-binding protein [Enorma phocaeensis]|uniref:ABC transporter ATP-binding protein n=1 Tax=Enorma phocaeensis TaxID=1871019 RepID=A0ABT7V856_9ACTN|nr:ABC transporter ATP-binding protein [Enorma phocaeensis]MDM8274678.1 ABC transporter ATP-binding protein [Enorma phocaeensis]
MAYIEFHNVVKRFGDNTVLDHIDFGIQKGDLVTLLGPSGCGKSTLLRCLSGLETVTEGSIILDGVDVTDMPASKRNIGMVFQQYSLFPNMNVEQNIAFGLKMQKVPADQIAEKVAHAIELVELKGKERTYPASLSGGQQQRVALARSIVTEPKVLLLDEPLSAIDAKLRKALQSRIREIHQELGLTSIFVTHDQDEAMVMSDVIQLFHAGRIEQSGSPVEVYTQPVSEFAASFIGSYNQLSRDEFHTVTGSQVAAGHVVAIRPETIGISGAPAAPSDDAYQVKAMVVDSVPRGNVLRYTVRVGAVKLFVDTLFRSFQMFDPGADVYLSIPKHDCLAIPEGALREAA